MVLLLGVSFISSRLMNRKEQHMKKNNGFSLIVIFMVGIYLLAPIIGTICIFFFQGFYNSNSAAVYL